jgi:LAO/AO transport system kinase
VRDKVKKIIAGDQLAGARLIRLLEEGDPEGREVLKLLYPHTGKAFVVGITGPAGSGKSTLVNCIVTEFRRRNLKVAVVAIDPSSSISGGALLGDRIRMRSHAEDKGVFIRSMATRGHLGGLNKTAREAVLVFDAMGFDIIVIETVGVGQDEVEIAQLAHTTAVVSLPATGDGIQAMKAGLLEIGDVFIVNKADFPGADDVVWQLKNMLEITGDSGSNWHPPILKTVAVKSEGMTDLADALLSHRQFLLESGKFSEHNYKHDIQFFRQIVMEMAADRIFNRVKDQPAFLDLLENLKKRNIDPFSAAEHVIEDMQ